MQNWLTHAGVVVGAITGILAAKGKRIDLFGVLVLAIVTGLGGGTVRDLLLGNTPIFWVKEPLYLYSASITAVVWFFLARRIALHRDALLIADAWAMAFFTIVGVKVGLMKGIAPSTSIALGVITGVAGGILRDSLLGEIPLVFRREVNFYATASMIGAAVYVALFQFTPVTEIRNMTVSVCVILVIRLSAIRWKLTLPEYRGGA